MNKAVVAQKGPYEVKVQPGDRVLWCQCGHSATQPKCDGSHKLKSDVKPVMFIAEKAETVYFCGCKQTKNPPFCDGSHSSL